MLSQQTLFHIKRITQSIWVRPVFYVLGATIAVLLGPFFDALVPAELYRALQDNALKDILTILASSMLSVAIFSLGTMVAAYQVGASAATPRARPLLTRDRTAQNAISTFIGAFLFSLLGITGLSIELFSDGGRFILFILSVALIILVLATFIRWMQRLTNLGGVTEVIDQVEEATQKAFHHLAYAENLGATPISKMPSSGAQLTSEKHGFVQYIDTQCLRDLAQQSGQTLTVCVRPGAWVHAQRPLIISAKKLEDKIAKKIRAAFVIGDQRTFEADPRYGLVILAEIATRALSPAINDPGTAIDVIGTASRVIVRWQQAKSDAAPDQQISQLQILEMDMYGLLEDTFASTIRYGGDQYDVAVNIQRALTLIMQTSEPKLKKAAKTLRDEALTIAQNSAMIESDKKLILDQGRRLYPLDAAR